MIYNVLFWLFLIILLYAYVGYAFLLWIIVAFKKILIPSKKITSQQPGVPDVCLFVTAYNEMDCLAQKVENSLRLNYPKEKIQYLWITDGSNDGTFEFLKSYKQFEVHHESERCGKIHAINRGIKYVKAPIIIFSDANAFLGENAVSELVNMFEDITVGCVAGEKRILQNAHGKAATAGESLYWKMESRIKQLDWQLHSTVGAVGELFALRTDLFQKAEKDTLLDDLTISLAVVQKGYKIAYAPKACAKEKASLNVSEELKRKIRIAAGGIQCTDRLKELLNPFRYGVFSWQFFSHKVLRWTLAPISLFLLFIINIILVYKTQSWLENNFVTIILYLQGLCYSVALLGWFFEKREIRVKVIYVPYYFVMINYASLRGMFRYFRGKQSVNWEKSKRSQ